MKNYIAFLFIALWSIAAWGQNVFDPNNPKEPGTLYTLTLNVNPANAGNVSPSAKAQYVVGQNVTLTAQANANYRFIGWKQGNDPVSESLSFNYTIPAMNSVLTACFVYDPVDPNEPDTMALKRVLTLVASPGEGGHFNINSGTKFDEGTSVELQAYPNSNYVFSGWKIDNVMVSTNMNYTLILGKKNVEVIGTFRYDPIGPKGPNVNNWNKVTGELIVDEFTAGYLSTAIIEAIGGWGNLSQVLKIKVVGEMNSGDLGALIQLPNCSELDLSRITGISTIPSWSFNGSGFSRVILPATITSIGDRAFLSCSNLAEVVCYAFEPPTLGWNVFEGIAANAVLRVQPLSIAKYSAAAQWNQFVILPFAENVGALEVGLPASAINGKYKNMFVELLHTSTAQKLRLNVTDKMSYLFMGLPIGSVYNVFLKDPSGLVLGEIKEVKINGSDTKCVFASLIDLKAVKVSIVDEKGVLAKGCVVKWYDAAGKFIAQGDSLRGLAVGTLVHYVVELNDNLGMLYVAPTAQNYEVVEGDNVSLFTLKPFSNVEISGVITNDNSQPLEGAVVSVSQLLNGKYSKAFTVKSNKEGRYSATVLNDVTTFTYSYPKCIGETLAKSHFDGDTDMGTTVLKQIQGITITTLLTYTRSVVPGDNLVKEDGYSNYQNITYQLYNKTQGKGIANFVVQYPTLVLLEEAAVGDVIEVTASSRTGEFDPIKTTATVGSDRKAMCAIDIVQQGYITASYVASGKGEQVAMLYNATGQLLKQFAYVNKGIVTGGLKEGVYSLVSMTSSLFFNSVYNLSDLKGSGLTEGTDYVIQTVTVKQGVISVIAINTIPSLDESKLYYTGLKTLFSANKSTITVGNYLTLRASIDFKEGYAGKITNLKLGVNLPENCSFVNSSVLVGNSVINNYTLSDNQLMIPMANFSDGVRFCIIPTVGGKQSPSAFVEFDLEGKTIQQPIGAASFVAEELSISVPQYSVQTKVTVKGSAVAGSDVFVYDNNVMVGQTKALANGRWNLKFELFNPLEFSFHDLYAEVHTPLGLKLFSESKQMTYNSHGVDVSKVTMINVAHNSSSLALCEYQTVFDFQNPALKSPVYWFWPSYPQFTFKVEFTQNDTALVKNVLLKVITASDGAVFLHPKYDGLKKLWMATANFDSGNLPVNVEVGYSYNDTTVAVGSYTAAIGELVSDAVPKILFHSPLVYVYDVSWKNGFSNSKFVNFKLPIDKWPSAKKVLSDGGYELITVSDNKELYLTNNSYFFIRSTNDSILVNAFVDVTEYTYFLKILKHFFPLIDLGDYASDTIPSNLDGIDKRRDLFIQSYIDKALRKHKCVDEKTQLILDGAVAHLRRYLSFTFIGYIAYSLNLFDVTGVDPIFYDGMTLLNDYIKRQIDVINYTPDCDEPGTLASNCPDATFVLDPSGYVYEAVPSNRLAGVTTSVFYKTEEEDMYGDKHEKIVLWDAENYAQENPLFTDESGMYAWDVPQGLWQVKYEKEGYQTTYSEWLPVPPPQLEINIGMVQTTQPSVSVVKGFESGIEVEFDKYMQPLTLNLEFVTVTRNGVKENGTIQLMNEEMDSRSGKSYATVFKYLPATPFLATDKVIISIDRKVKSYADVMMGVGFTKEVEIIKELKELTVTPSVTVAYSKTKQLMIQAQPSDVVNGKKLSVYSASPSIVAVVSQTDFNANGMAEITVRGDLPGTSVLTIGVEESELLTESQVKVVMSIEKALQPNASVSAGSTVEKNSSVILSTTQSDAIVYYTIDGSSPVTSPTRIRYTLPITIVYDVMIRAITVVDGMDDSDVATFDYYIATQLGDSNQDSEVDVFDVVNVVGYISGNNPYPFSFNASDVITNQIIDVYDVAGVIHIILTPISSLSKAFEGNGTGTISCSDGRLIINTTAPVQVFDFIYEGEIAPTNYLNNFTFVRYKKDGERHILAYTMSKPIPSECDIPLFTYTGSLKVSKLSFATPVGGDIIFDKDVVTDTEKALSDGVELYVNKDVLYVQATDPVTSMEVLDMNGTVVARVYAASMSVASINKGIYIVKVIIGEKEYRFKCLLGNSF